MPKFTKFTESQTTEPRLPPPNTPDPFIPYGRQSISNADIAAVVEILKSDWLTQGPAIEQFEQTAALNSARSQSHADLTGAVASLLEANCGLSLAEADLKRAIGQMPQ